MRSLTNHDNDIFTNYGKILTNLTLTVAENDCLTPDVKGHLRNTLIIYDIQKIGLQRQRLGTQTDDRI